MINIPNKDQWQKMNEHLASIAGALGTQLDVSTWSGVQKAVRAGMGPVLFPIGTSLKVTHDTYGELQFDVVAHDQFKSARDDDAHTMTLMCHDLIARIQFDAPEALYYANDILPADRYKFSVVTKFSEWLVGEYDFELLNDLPQGGSLCISGNPATALTALKVMAYDAGNALLEECDIRTSSSFPSALPLDGMDGLNHLSRVAYGSDNYKESAIRQFLNSSAAAGSVWTPQTWFDRPPTWSDSTAGFLYGIDSEFLGVVGEVKVPCIANDSYEAPDSTTKTGETYVLEDKFYLASAKEVLDAGDKVPEDGSTVYAFFKGASNADRIKYFSGSARVWGSRSPYTTNAYSCCCINTDGTFYSAVMSTSLGVAPVCNIV